MSSKKDRLQSLVAGVPSSQGGAAAEQFTRNTVTEQSNVTVKRNSDNEQSNVTLTSNTVTEQSDVTMNNNTVTETSVIDTQGVLQGFDPFAKKLTIEDTHTRQTYLIRNDLISRLDKLAKRKDRGFKTRLVNHLLEQALNELENKG